MRLEHWIYTVPLRLCSLFRRQRADQDLEEEIRDHLERRIADYVAQGMSLEEARYAAQREFGGIEQAKEGCRDKRKVNWIFDLAQVVSCTLRQLRKNRGFAALAILTLALGIGANTAMFTIINSVLLRPLPFRNADRLVSIKVMWGISQTPVSWLNYHDIRNRSRSLEDVMGRGEDSTVIVTPQGGQKVVRATMTANLLDMLGVRPAPGRPFDNKDYAYGAAPVVLLSAELWRGGFAADPVILGRQVRLGGVPLTVVGIMPDGFHFEEESADIISRVWLPMQISPSMLSDRGEQDMDMIGRLKPGVTPQAAQAELAAIAQDIRNRGAEEPKYIVEPYRDVMTDLVRPGLLALSGALFLILAIACVNVANLQLARHLARRQELAVRAALGAGRSRLLRQLMAEGTVLTIAGTVAGLGFASLLAVVGLAVGLPASLAVGRLLRAFLYGVKPIDGLTYFGVAIVLLAVTLAAALIPARNALRTDLRTALQ